MLVSVPSCIWSRILTSSVGATIAATTTPETAPETNTLQSGSSSPFESPNAFSCSASHLWVVVDFFSLFVFHVIRIFNYEKKQSKYFCDGENDGGMDEHHGHRGGNTFEQTEGTFVFDDVND